MKTLILMRHAKSSWDTPVSDAERVLNARGRESASALGRWLKEQQLKPDAVLCSNAARTLETAERLDLGTAIKATSALYLASSDRILAQIQMAQGDCLLVIGHNPGIADLAERMAKSPATHPQFAAYPTGATTVFSCDTSRWADLKPGQSTVSHFVVPRDLTG